ncbi:MAG: hypothetical protein DMD82_02660, partial [Candidatus Rokuibacteriota bacterium]
MRPRSVARAFTRLRVRVALLLIAGVAFQAVGFEALITSLTRRWLVNELESRSRALAVQLAERSEMPLVVGDSLQLALETRSVRNESDVIALGVYTEGGRRVAGWAATQELKAELERGPEAGTATQVASRMPEALEVTAPIRGHSLEWSGHAREARELFGMGADGMAPAGAPTIGMVRVIASTRRVEESVNTASRLGLLVLLAALALGLVAFAALIGVVVRPLREAGDLAREIALGNLERRLPVESDDELGHLAESMNTMAAALNAARLEASGEAQRLRTATEAVVAIAREARLTHEPVEVFQLVAPQVRRVTGCEGVALAVPGKESGTLELAHLDPPSPWAVLREHEVLDREIVFRIDSVDTFTRVALEADDSELARALRADGYRAALLVPLTLETGPPALLILAAREANAFPSREAEIVTGLATHLSSALRSARLNESLEHAIAELDRTRDYLVQSGMLRVAGEMASGVAHEFNNILGAVLGRAQLLRGQLERGEIEPAQVLGALEIIERVAQDGGETVRRLRLFGKTGEEAVVEPVDVDAVLRDAMEFTRPRWSNEALAAGLSIAIELDSGPGLWVNARPYELREVFTNLILNSADAMPSGGAIRLSAREQNGRVLASVEDDGLGMNDETRDRMFEPFFTTKGESGTGLGMSVAYGIVQRHGGQIAVSSQPGRGTRVEVSLPVTSARPVQAPARRAPAPPAATGPMEVLVIDDEDAVRDLLA